MKLLFFFSLLFSVTLYAQTQFEFYHEKEQPITIDGVDKVSFTPFQEKINKGLNNGVYWIKITNSNSNVLEIPSAKLFDFECYRGIKKISNTIFPTFSIPSNKTSYLKVIAKKEAYIPVYTYTKNEYSIHQRNQLLRAGLYYGFAIMIIIINLFYYFTFRDGTFLYYAFFLFTISIGLLYRDGLTVTLTHNKWWITEGEMPIHILIPICGALFAGSYLQHKLYLPKIKYLTVFMMLIVVSCYFSFLFTRKVVFYAVGDMIAINVLTLYWLTGVYLYRKNTFAKFFTIAYSFILILAFDFFISPLIGVPNIGVTTDLLKIGGVFEMLILSYAVVYRMQFLQKENQQVRNELYLYTQKVNDLTKELAKNEKAHGNSIQNLNLTPRQVHILKLLQAGKTNKEIAGELNISINTVKYHIKTIYDILQIKSRKETLQFTAV